MSNSTGGGDSGNYYSLTSSFVLYEEAWSENLRFEMPGFMLQLCHIDLVKLVNLYLCLLTFKVQIIIVRNFVGLTKGLIEVAHAESLDCSWHGI